MCNPQCQQVCDGTSCNCPADCPDVGVVLTTPTPNINVDVRTNGWNIGLLTGPVFGTRRMNGHYFDVAPEFATASRPSYRAPGGAAGWRAVAGASRRFGDFWMGAFVAGDTVRGARFEDSPLVRRHDTLAFGVGVSWVFATSSQRVPDEH